MSVSSDIEEMILTLSASERERLAVSVWESLVCDPDAASDPDIDREGIETAAARDVEIDDGDVSALDSKEFHRLTDGSA